jgi:hypothetical protein
VVAADGVHSHVRQVLGLPPLMESNTTNFRGTLDCCVLIGVSYLYKPYYYRDKSFQWPSRWEVTCILYSSTFIPKKSGRLAWILATTTSSDIPPHQDDDDDDNHHHHQANLINPVTIARANIQDPAQLRLLEEIFASSADHHMQPYPKTSIVDLSDHVLATAKDFMDGGWGWSRTNHVGRRCRPCHASHRWIWRFYGIRRCGNSGSSLAKG